MTEALKELRRAAELDLSGPKNEANQNELKKVISKTVKATKVSRAATTSEIKDNGMDEDNDENKKNLK